MKIRIYESEIEEEIVKALVNEDTKQLIMNGDYYHDKITEKIQGFLQGLDYTKFGYEWLETKVISEDDDMYSICRFDML